jgi:hypothetical protein
MSAVDTTVWYEHGRWCFFTTVSELPGHAATLLLFHADSLTGEWPYHPTNPISTDVRTACAAGPIVRAGGRRFRPSQGCSTSYVGLQLYLERDCDTDT